MILLAGVLVAMSLAILVVAYEVHRMIKALPTGPCAVCGAQTIIRYSVEGAGHMLVWSCHHHTAEVERFCRELAILGEEPQPGGDQ